MNANNPVSFTLNEIERRIIFSCCRKAMSVKELAALLDLPYGGGDMKRSISRLLQLQLIEYTFPEYHRSYAQRYKTTLKGREAVR